MNEYSYCQVPIYLRTSSSTDRLELDSSKGEIICPVCTGYGHVSNSEYYNMQARCPKCQGKRKLDWVERITGVKPPEEKVYGCFNYGVCKTGGYVVTCSTS